MNLSDQNSKDDVLFEKLADSKKKKKRKIILIVVIVAAAVAAGLIVTFSLLQNSINEQVGLSGPEITSAEVSSGSISTLVTGYGMLENVDVDTVSVPSGVEIKEVKVSANDTLKAGDIIATVDETSVAEAISAAQQKLDSYDKQLEEENSSAVSTSVKAGVSGRVKEISASPGTSVVDCMVKNGSLMIISTDGFMAAEIESDLLKEGDTVTVVLPGGTETEGKVENVILGKATVLVSDDSPMTGDNVTVRTSSGETAGSGDLYVHNPIAVTAYAGNIKSVNVSVNEKVSSSATVVTLQDTQFSAKYETILRARNEKEAELLELINIYKNGALVAPMDGTVCSIEYNEDDSTDTSDDSENQLYDFGLYSSPSSDDTSEKNDTSSGQETPVVKMSSNSNMKATLEISENDILSVETGQSAEIYIYSIGEESFEGTVTGIIKSATTSGESTTYKAEITIEKTDDMLSGMSCEGNIRIEGVDNALLIPVEALNQTSDSSYVYTEYNQDTKELGGIKEVTTGLSDGVNIEITSGLSEGDTVYYQAAEEDWFDMMMDGGPGSFDGMMGGEPGAPGGIIGGASGDMYGAGW